MKEEPSQIMNQYTTSSTGLMEYLRNQLASFGLWTNIPGTLSKLSTSSKGFVWGYNSTGQVWTCKEPCVDGKWTRVQFNATPIDIATDSIYVYILHTVKREITVPPPPPIIPMKGPPNPNDLDNTIPHPPLQKPAQPTVQDWMKAGSPGRQQDTRRWGAPLLFSLEGSSQWITETYQKRLQEWEAGWAKYNEAFAAKKTRDLAANPQKSSVTSTVISYKPVDNTGSWQEITVPFNADRVAVTNGFLWVSSGKQNAYCGKPCTTANWNVRSDNRSILGGGSSSVFATEPGKSGVLKSDETAQTGWTPIKGLEGITTSSLAAEADNSVLYASDSSKVYRCTDTCDKKDKLEVVNAQGFVPIQTKGSLSVNPTTRNVWMASQVGSTGGNIFSRLDAPDNMPILNMVDDSQRQQDRAVNSLGGSLEVSTAQLSSAMTKKEVLDAFKQVTELSGDTNKLDNEIHTLQRKIDTTSSQISGIQTKNKPLITILIALAIVAIMYLTLGWFLPYSISMIFAVLVLGAGLGLAIYFSTQ